MDNKKREKKLIEWFNSKTLGVGVAFSGGVDSSLLAAAVSKSKVEGIVITAVTPYMMPREIKEARQLAKKLKLKHLFIEVNSIPLEIENNPKDRCYLCKSMLFKEMGRVAKKEGFSTLVDGTNVDDLGEYRPGLKALEELKVESPFKEVGFRKKDIRELSSFWNLKTAEKPSYACLLTRLPYEELVTKEKLLMVNKAEEFLRESGFNMVRVRVHTLVGEGLLLARIELNSNERFKLLQKASFLDEVDLFFKNLGFSFITLNLAGYKTGSMDV